MKAKVGAYYFDGWRRRTERLKTEFAYREPEWGWDDGTQVLMDRQIDLAADHGISYWAFDWYFPEKGESGEANGRSGSPYDLEKDLFGTGIRAYDHCDLNEALYLYLRSEMKSRVQFCLLVANHPPFRIASKDWKTVCRIWLDLFKRREHLTIDGRPVIFIFHPQQLIEAFGSEDGLKQALNGLKEKARAEAVGDPYLVACSAMPQARWKKAGYDAVSGYNGYAAVCKRLGLIRGEHRPYIELARGIEELWRLHINQQELPFIPWVNLGWDNRPRNPEQKMDQPYFRFTDPEPVEISGHLGNAIKFLDSHQEKTPRDRLVIMYAWNEVAENAYLVPRKDIRTARLIAAKGVLYEFT